MKYFLFCWGLTLLFMSYLSIYYNNLISLKSIAPLFGLIAGFIIYDSFEQQPQKTGDEK